MGAGTGTSSTITRSRRPTVTNDQGYVTASYSGSVTEVASGKVDSVSGTIDAWFRWQGCGWVMSGFTY